MTALGPALLDVNVLAAFLLPSHMHHAAARRWYAAASGRGFATCPITELGAARLLANPAVSRVHIRAQAALQLVGEFVSREQHAFWAADLAVSDPRLVRAMAGIHGPGQLTDRYLLALAAAHDGALATFDRALAASLPADSPLHAHLELIPG